MSVLNIKYINKITYISICKQNILLSLLGQLVIHLNVTNNFF